MGDVGKYSLEQKEERQRISKEGVPQSVNISLILIWVIVLVIGIAIIIGAISYVIITANNLQQSGPLGVTPYCSDLTAGLPDISDEPFCVGEGNVKYNATLLVDSAPPQIAYQTVCRQFCPEGQYNPDTDTCSSTNPDITERVNNCVSATKPVNCIGQAMPISVSNGTPYYAQNADLIGCQT